MAAGKRKNNSKNNKSNSRKKVANRIQNALEIAERQINAPGESEEYVKKSRNARLNGTIVNPFKKQKGDRDDDSDDGSKFDYGKGFDIEGSDFEDEEIDSDEAFGSDEELFDAYDSKFSQTVRDLKLKNGDANGNHSDEDFDPEAYTSIDEDELMPLSAIWDVNEKTEKEDEAFEKKRKEKLNNNDETKEFQLELNEDVDMESESSESESSSEDANEEDEDDIFGKDSDDEVDLTTVSSKLKKQVNKGKKPEHRMLSEYNNSLFKEENEFSPLSSKSTNNMNATSNKLDINDLMNVLNADDAKKASLLSVNDTEANKAMDAPLSKSMQEKNERKVAYSITKDEVSKWQDTVQMIRRSEQVDYSKLNEAEGAKKVESSAFIQPSSNVRSVLESKIDKVLTDSNLNTVIKQDSAQLADVSPDNFEDLPVAKMTKEELLKRNQEMRLMRELMFREERKAKRIKKIKSKSYRKIKRKELLKNQQLLDEEDEDEDMEDADIKRARERMTLKHKNTSKWARDMVKHGMTKDKETREELEEMLRQGEQLTNRIHGKDDSGRRKGMGSDDEPVRLSDLEREDQDTAMSGSVGKTGVLGMKFMTDAEQRKKEQNRKEIEALRRFENGESDNEDIFEDQFGEGINKAKNQGRRVYTPSAMLSKQELEGVEADNEVKAETVKELPKNADAKPAKKEAVEEKKEKEVPAQKDTSNPWLDEDSDDEKHVKKSSKVHVIDKDSSKIAKAAHKIKKHQDKADAFNKSSSNSGGNEMILDIEKNTLNIIDPYSKVKTGNGDEVYEEGFQNEDLISQAFAGDDVVSKFEQEKQRVIIDEDDKQVDMTLPGWGGWAGEGVKNKNQKKIIKTIKGVAKKDKRRDKNLKNVIINEKVNKKNLKYQASAVPFPYENKEQYEKSLQIPLGPEWSSSNTYAKAIKPRAIVKKSQVIDPLKKPFN
jgi:U3 small nucleolar RNA-associated protein 14